MGPSPITRVAVIGECMVELTKNQGQLTQSFGGDTLNTAVYLSRLTTLHGVSTSYVTGLGKDSFSQEMLTAWQKEKINTNMVTLSETKLPGMYAIETTNCGERSFHYWRNDSAAKYWLRELDHFDVLDELCEHQLIYLSGISLAILPDDCRKSLMILLNQCRAKGVKIAFDNNFRPALWPDLELARTCYRDILTLSDIAFLTFDDEALLWGDDIEQQAIDRTLAFGVEEIIVKRGSDNCFIVTKGSFESVAANPIDSIVDTTAAGDSFSAGYLAKRILGGDMTESACSGHLVAGTVIQHSGAIIPTEVMPTI
ncbi:sugar kinase [Vibrio kyushuensis]|uniref:sugar kinase n=1 Tax=Vibrio kyushuensis TaxID=2910249 RepID=UPI003D136C93